MLSTFTSHLFSFEWLEGIWAELAPPWVAVGWASCFKIKAICNIPGIKHRELGGVDFSEYCSNRRLWSMHITMLTHICKWLDCWAKRECCWDFFAFFLSFSDFDHTSYFRSSKQKTKNQNTSIGAAANTVSAAFEAKCQGFCTHPAASCLINP